MKDIKVTLVQYDLIWEQREKNYKKLNKIFDQIENHQDIILLPEMFSTGFTTNIEDFSENMDGPTVSWLRHQTMKYKSVIAGSFIFDDGSKCYNRLVWMQTDGKYHVYDKRHLFRFGNEHNYFSSGEQKHVFIVNDFRICPLICYDLRFPVWAKNTYTTGKFEYDILIYIANWPEARRHHWEILLKARAIENLAYVIGLNRIGEDGRKIKYSGNSMIVNPRGEIIGNFDDYEEGIKTITLSKNELTQYREKFNVGVDWDNFTIQ